MISLIHHRTVRYQEITKQENVMKGLINSCKNTLVQVYIFFEIGFDILSDQAVNLISIRFKILFNVKSNPKLLLCNIDYY